MRIGLDVMGGDNAPHAILDGALDACARLDPDDELCLVGDLPHSPFRCLKGSTHGRPSL